jgi:Zn-dependent protease
MENNEQGIQTYQDYQLRISPVFLLLVGLMIGSALPLWDSSSGSGLWTFLFIVCGWVVSLCLHEFGHAFSAFKFGDYTVVEKGYLTLNPVKYTNLFLSIAMPLLFLMMGGIGFPGGAVYINTGLLKTAREKSIVSAAGPFATALFAAILIFPFAFGLVDIENHRTFWAAVSLLALLQISALFLNLLPIPGLDGFGIIEPYLKSEIRKKIRNISGIAILVIFFLLFSDTPVSSFFWSSIALTVDALGIDFKLVLEGYNQFRFWT